MFGKKKKISIMPKKLLNPINFSRQYIFYIHELKKIVMIHKHKDLMLATFLVILPYFQS